VRATPIHDETGKVTGAIEVFQVRSDVDISRSELEKYKKESFTDALTNTGNRRYAELILQTRFYQLINLEIPFGLIFIDLDDFKLINDQFGHLAGDEILKMVSRSVQSSLRGPDTIIRWGGDEFLVILQTLVRSSYLMVKAQKISINLSLGATLAVTDDTHESLIHRADQLMYQSKQSGKNQGHIG
jgi:diguanylate cyclase (GGDEF)-like protein